MITATSFLPSVNLAGAAGRVVCVVVKRSLGLIKLISAPCLFQMEKIVDQMQHEETGVPVRTVKSFMTKIPSVFTGADLILWMMRNLDVEDQCECLHPFLLLLLLEGWLSPCAVDVFTCGFVVIILFYCILLHRILFYFILIVFSFFFSL